HAAMQPKSQKRSFNDTDVSGFQTDLSPHRARTNKGRTKPTSEFALSLTQHSSASAAKTLPHYC
ncbi:MAG TPA: hypothetical protein DIT67_01320, partial [Octadecabacter sp.]|nr:hypothetical protein [Octadecabacter sp.]